MTRTPPVIDYEGSTYSTEFWNPSRDYEDRAERIALRALLPPRGRRLIDIGAGAGRLGDMYTGYDEVILMDYARSTVIEARERWAHDARFKFVAADLYALPFADGAFDTVVMVRVIHHIVDVSRALGNVAAALRPGGSFVFEFANKRHLKSLLRYALRRQRWSPFDRSPVEFAELNFDFHPDWMKTQLRHAGFAIRSTRAVSTFRMGALKRLIGARRLAALDGVLQRPLAALAISPSLFALCRTPGEAAAVNEVLFVCPQCRRPLSAVGDELRCANGHRWSARDGVYDLKSPL
jgi:SAM-dependent methyltransferase